MRMRTQHGKSPGQGRGVFLGLLLLALFLSITLSACNLARSLRGRASVKATSSVTLFTPRPTFTPTPPPTPTPLPTATPTSRPSIPTQPQAAPTAASVQGELIAIPSKPNTAFTIELTEAQINAYLAGKTYEQQGVSVSNVRVTIPGNEVMITLLAKQQDSGLSAGITARGVPVVVNGAAYVRIEDVTLDQSISGFARMIAQGVIDTAIKQYSTPNGILIPTEGVIVEQVRLAPGKIVIVGRTR